MIQSLLILLATVGFVAAQTYTKCDPTKRDCPSDLALGTNATFDFIKSTASSKVWNIVSGPINYMEAGAQFEIDEAGDGPTLESQFYIFFGRVSTVMQAASGRGIVSSIVLLSDDLDEIDWEMIGSNSTTVQSNYYGKGNNTDYTRVKYHEIEEPQKNFYNYTTVWTQDKLEWWIDDKLIRTLNYGDALGGRNYPQTPCKLKIGSWVGGKKGNKDGTIKWAGGLADFSDGPFTMTVRSVYVEDFGSGKRYEYSDRSGSWQSIKSIEGKSSVAAYIEKPHGVKGHWNALPKPAQIAIICAATGIAGVLFLVLIFCCIRQRRAGRRERALADAEYEKSAAELMEFRSRAAARAASVKKGGAAMSANRRFDGAYAGGQKGGKGNNVSVSVMEAGKPMKSGWL